MRMDWFKAGTKESAEFHDRSIQQDLKKTWSMNKQMAHNDPHHLFPKIVQSHSITLPIVTTGFNKKPSGPFAAYKSSTQRLHPSNWASELLKICQARLQWSQFGFSTLSLLVGRIPYKWFTAKIFYQNQIIWQKYDSLQTLLSNIFTSICMTIHWFSIFSIQISSGSKLVHRV